MFMCHQAVEKALKAIIARDCAEDEFPPKIHHLPKLAERAGLYKAMSQEQQAFVRKLNPMNLEARYPEHKRKVAEGLSIETCREIMTETEKLPCWIKGKL